MGILRIGGVLGLVATLAACASGPVPSDYVNDPLEGMNRRIHDFNVLVDKTALRPVSATYGAVVPAPVRTAINRSADNLGLPVQVVNRLLQGNLSEAAKTTARFFLNSTIGLAGMLDPASDIGLFEKSTDFGETLGVWGVAEGPYLELPLFGASTVRGTVGMAVDFAIDPLQYVISTNDRKYILVLKGANLVGKRYAYSDLVDALLYESADSYAAQRISYLQNMRRNLQGETLIQDLEDPYAF